MAVNYNQLRIDTPETRAALEQEYANRPLTNSKISTIWL